MPNELLRWKDYKFDAKIPEELLKDNGFQESLKNFGTEWSTS
jgi:hypothetical protein